MEKPRFLPKIFILSGGVGSSGEQVVYTILAQYPDAEVEIRTIAHLRRREQIAAALSEAHREEALVVHTLVEEDLRRYLIQEGQRLDVECFDLMGPIFNWLTPRLDQAPEGAPGLYRQLNREYFERVAAIDYTMAHDDGKNPQGWAQADLVLLGVSRVGKTPLSLYLAVLGWKVANQPLVPGINLPSQVYELERGRIIGLTIEPGQLIQYRRQRQSHLGAPGTSAYIDPAAVFDELQEALDLFHRYRFTVIDMTDKTIEMGADEIIRKVSRLDRK